MKGGYDKGEKAGTIVYKKKKNNQSGLDKEHTHMQGRKEELATGV